MTTDGKGQLNWSTSKPSMYVLLFGDQAASSHTTWVSMNNWSAAVLFSHNVPQASDFPFFCTRRVLCSWLMLFNCGSPAIFHHLLLQSFVGCEPADWFFCSQYLFTNRRWFLMTNVCCYPLLASPFNALFFICWKLLPRRWRPCDVEWKFVNLCVWYTVGHKKRATWYSFITLFTVCRIFLNFRTR